MKNLSLKENFKRRAKLDWNLEIGAISRRGIDLRGPALLFENIKGYPKGYRVLANIMTASKPNIQARVALGIGLPKDTPTLKIIDNYAERTSRTPINPKSLRRAPAKRIF